MGRSSKQTESTSTWHPQDDADVAVLDAPSGADILADLERLERSAPPSGAMVANEAERRAAQSAKVVAPMRKSHIGRGRMVGGKNVTITPMGESPDVPAPTFDRAARRDFLVRVVMCGADVEAALRNTAAEWSKLLDARIHNALSTDTLDRFRVLEVERSNLQLAQIRLAQYRAELLALVPPKFTAKQKAVASAVAALSGISGLDRVHQTQVDKLRADLIEMADVMNNLAMVGDWNRLEVVAD